jgi:hypothetical protein
MPVFFDGELLVTPAVRSRVDDAAMANQNAAVGNLVCLIGRSQGGEPKTPIYLSSPAQAAEVLRDGELLTAALKAFAPSADTGGPSQVVAMRVNPAVQAELTLLDATSQPVIELASTDYGLYTNQISIQIESGTTRGKRLTTRLGNDYASQDNVGRDAFTVQYSGGAVTAVMTVTNATVTLEAPSGSSVATIDLAVYDTVQKLVDRINAVASFSATVVSGSANTAALNGLDGVVAQDVKTAIYTAKADLQACIDWFNGRGEGYVTATRPAAANAPPANIGVTYLSAGSDGNVTSSDWSDCFSVLQTVDVQWLVPLSPDAAIHAMADAHAQFMSGAGKMERRAFVGGPVGVARDDAIAAAKLLNSDREAYVWPGYYDFDAAGALNLYPPYMLAAVIGGAFAGINPGEPLTNKSLALYGMEVAIRDPGDTNLLINGGVLAVRETPRGFKVVKSVTTWLNDSKYNRVEVSTGAATDYTARAVRVALDQFVGQKANPLNLERARSVTESALRELARPEPTGLGILAGDADHPAYRNITASIAGDVLRVEFECSPVVPLNYVLVTIHAVPFAAAA